jgi:hypothetical protein
MIHDRIEGRQSKRSEDGETIRVYIVRTLVVDVCSMIGWLYDGRIAGATCCIAEHSGNSSELRFKVTGSGQL